MESVPDPKLGALTPLGGFAGIPDVLKQLMWDPVAVSEAEPVNATEAALAQVIDDKLRVRSVASIPKFLHILQHAKTEADEALVLVVLRATATGTDAKLSAACTAAFEKCGGLKIAKKWLNEAVDWNYSDLLVLLLDVLKVLPVQLNSITEARINEPIVQLRKTAQEDKVRRAAQDLLKHWRGRFTEKEKEKEKAKVPAASPAASSSKAEMKEVSSCSATTATTPKTAAEAAVGDAKALKTRSIKRLERMPFGGSGASPASSSSSKSSELIGNLMQRKSVKDAAASKTKKAASDNKDSSSSESSSKQVSADGPSDKETKEELVMQLPTIQSFKAVTTTTSVSKKIRWADEEGKDLVKIKLIESWRDMIHYQPHDESSFKDAKLREHEAERQMMKSQKERDAFSLVMAHEWTTPAMVKLPEALVARREPVKTEEVEAQSARTRREMEFVVLDGEVPPLSPKEWTRTNEPHRGAPKEIPLLDVDSAAAAAAAAPPVSSYADPNETEEERALREALGPLQRSTIALLMENEHVLPIVYEEAQRNGNRIPDGRVVEIIEFHRRQAPPGQRFNGPPPGAGGMPMYDSGYNQYGAGYDYARQQYAPPPHQHMHPPQQSLKRKAPGGILADAPPPSKRLPKRGAAPCAYFRGPAGCHLGSSCQFSHDVTSGPPPGMGGGPDYGGPYGPPQGGRFGHQPPMRGGGGGGMRGMRR